MHPVVLECDEQAIEIVEDMTGTMLYLACYDAWAVKLDESIREDDETIIASLDVDPRFQTDKMTVNIEACLHEFDLPLLFPDPVVFGYMYKMENFNLNSN